MVAAVLSNAAVIIHDIPLINTLVIIITSRRIILAPVFLVITHFTRGERKMGSSYPPPILVVTLTPDNRMAWRKRSLGGVERWKGIHIFIWLLPQCLQSVWKISLQCVHELPAVRACTWCRREYARGQGSPHGLNRIEVLLFPRRARRPLRLHRITRAFHTASFPFLSPPFPSWSPPFFCCRKAQ